MVSLKDIAGLEKLAPTLSYPFFGVAVFTSGYEFLTLHISVLSVRYLSFFFIVPLAAFFAFGVHELISDIDVKYCGGRLFTFLGLGLMGFGLLVLGRLASQEPIFNINVFWNLWALSHGFVLLESQKPESKTKNDS